MWILPCGGRVPAGSFVPSFCQGGPGFWDGMGSRSVASRVSRRERLVRRPRDALRVSETSKLAGVLGGCEAQRSSRGGRLGEAEGGAAALAIHRIFLRLRIARLAISTSWRPRPMTVGPGGPFHGPV